MNKKECPWHYLHCKMYFHVQDGALKLKTQSTDFPMLTMASPMDTVMMFLKIKWEDMED